MMTTLEPSARDISLLLNDTLKRCPFCGGRPNTLNYINKETAIYRSVVSCGRCEAATAVNDLSREGALNAAIDRWQTRVQRLESTS